MARKSDILVARTSGLIVLDGQRYQIRAGVTRVRDGHPILTGHEHMFQPLDVHYDIEDATARPGQKRSGKRRTSAEEPPKESGESE